MSAFRTVRTAHAAGRRRGSVPCRDGNPEKPERGHVLPPSLPEKSLSVLPIASAEDISVLLNTDKCELRFFSIADLAARWRVSRPAVYGYLRGHRVIDFAPAPGRRGHKIVSAEVVRQIERERERVMR